MVSGRLILALISSQKQRGHSVYNPRRLLDKVRRFILWSRSFSKNPTGTRARVRR